MKIALRTATLADLEWLEPFYEQVMRPYVEISHPWDETKFREGFQPGSAFIITVDGQDVGYYKIESRKDCLYLADIQVLPEHQGQGIGTRLIEVLKDRAVLEAKAIRLRVLKENPASQLYQRLGFILIEQISDEFHFAMEWSP